MKMFPKNYEEFIAFLIEVSILIGIFAFIFIVLKLLVFRPYLKIRERREQLTHQAQGQAQSLNAQTEEMVQNYEAKLNDARQEGLSFKETARKSGEAEAREILSQASQRVDETAEASRREIAKQVQEAEEKLRQYSQELSKEMAEKLLGRKVSA